VHSPWRKKGGQALFTIMDPDQEISEIVRVIRESPDITSVDASSAPNGMIVGSVVMNGLLDHMDHPGGGSASWKRPGRPGTGR